MQYLDVKFLWPLNFALSCEHCQHVQWACPASLPLITLFHLCLSYELKCSLCRHHYSTYCLLVLWFRFAEGCMLDSSHSRPWWFLQTQRMQASSERLGFFLSSVHVNLNPKLSDFRHLLLAVVFQGRILSLFFSVFSFGLNLFLFGSALFEITSVAWSDARSYFFFLQITDWGFIKRIRCSSPGNKFCTKRGSTCGGFARARGFNIISFRFNSS